jgi:beta-lactamase class A
MLIYLIEESDNTAFYTLIDLVSEEEFETARVAMGLPNLKDPSAISPRDYANMLRSLYLSTYLRRTFSEVALSLMINTDFDSGLPSGVPKSVKVAHKVGFSVSKGYFHDCGIIYDVHSDNIHPYILCVMSKNSTQQEANKVISNVSKTVYDYRHNNELS